MVGRLLCWLGWHRWRVYELFKGTIDIVIEACARCGAPRQ